MERAKHFILQFSLYKNESYTVMFDASIIFGQFLNQNEYSLCEILPFGNDNLNSYEKFLTTERKDSLYPDREIKI